MPSRRSVLAGGVGLLGGGLLADRTRLGPVESWSPPADTWPSGRYDPANTAATGAAAPDDPAVAWTTDLPPAVADDLRETTLVAGPERVFVGATALAAFDRDDGSEAWTVGRSSTELVLRDGRLFTAGGFRSEGDSRVAALRPADGSVDWERSLPDRAYGLVVTSGAALVQHRRGATAYERDLGRVRWRGLSTARPLVHDGALFTLSHGLARFRPRTMLDIPLRSPPTLAWEARPPTGEVCHPPVGGGERVLIPTRLESPTVDESTDALWAYDAASGAVAWSAVPNDLYDAATETGPLAADADRGRAYAGVYRRRGARREATVAGFALDDGERAWEYEAGLDRRVTDVVLAGGDLLVATRRHYQAESGNEGDLRALSPADGHERWRVVLDEAPRRLAPVDGTVFALTAAGTVVALR